MNKLVFYQNIVTSYRIDLFNEMASISKDHNAEFEAWYARKKIPGRFLPFDLDLIKFSAFYAKGFYLSLLGRNFNCNFDIVRRYVGLSKEDKIVLGSSWNDINVVIILFLYALGIGKAEPYIWIEANYMTRREPDRGWFFKKIRNLVLKLAKGGLVVPGHIAERTIRDTWGLDSIRLLKLPNLINGSFFDNTDQVAKPEKRIRLVTVARFDEVDKGLINFISKAHPLLGFFDWNIVGDGPDRDKIENALAEFGLSSSVNLHGNLEREAVREILLSSDVFLLPSFSDPNPISVVEALHSGLVMLISERCGNSTEAVADRENGIAFDPYDSNSIITSLQFLLDSQDSIDTFKKKSLEIAGSEFSLSNGVRSFLNQIFEI